MTTTIPLTPTAAPLARPSSSAADVAIPMTRLIKVELRKTMNTRAGRWLLTAIAGGTAVAMAIMVIVGLVKDQTFGVLDFTRVANFFPMGLLLPILGVLSVTGEWGQRTNMVTFTLEPRRSRIVAAKLLTGVLLALGAAAVALLAGLGSLAVFDLLGGTASWAFSGQLVGAFTLLQLINVLTGFAFGMLLLNTPAGIVTFFAYSFLLPTIFIGASSYWSWAKSAQPWIDFNFVQDPLMGGSLSGVNWVHFAVTAAIWFAAPVALGARRLLRAEIK